MRTMNRVYLVGHLGSEPRLAATKTGAPYATMNLATNRQRKTENGGWETITDWHRISVWGKHGEVCAQQLKKGQPVLVEGYLNTYETENSQGEKQRFVNVTATEVRFLTAPLANIS